MVEVSPGAELKQGGCRQLLRLKMSEFPSGPESFLFLALWYLSVLLQLLQELL